MFKYLMATLCSFIGFTALGQERKSFEGTITFEELRISAVHVINNSTNIGTITDENGVFKIPVKENDSLFISHINYTEFYVFITLAHLSKKKVSFQLEEKVERLNEITLGNGKSIFHVDKDLLIYEVKVTAKSLNLPNAGSEVKANKSIVRLNSGAVIHLDHLINTFNGTKKRARIVNQLSKEDTELNKIRTHLTDYFFVNSLKIKKNFIFEFLEFCKNKNIITAFKSNDELDFMSIIIRYSKQFLYKMEPKEDYITKN
jgi:hypothetical protein